MCFEFIRLVGCYKIEWTVTAERVEFAFILTLLFDGGLLRTFTFCTVAKYFL